jgi:hypothetical protein
VAKVERPEDGAVAGVERAGDVERLGQAAAGGIRVARPLLMVTEVVEHRPRLELAGYPEDAQPSGQRLARLGGDLGQAARRPGSPVRRKAGVTCRTATMLSSRPASTVGGYGWPASASDGGACFAGPQAGRDRGGEIGRAGGVDAVHEGLLNGRWRVTDFVRP